MIDLVNLQLLLAYVLAATLLVIVPGPNTAFIAATAMGRGRRAGVAAALGIELATLVHGTLAAVGLTAVVAASPRALLIVRLLGAGYLAWLGIRTLLRPAPGLVGADQPAEAAGRFLGNGFVVNLLNPKVIVFYLAFIPQFIDPAAAWPTWGQVLVCTLVLVVIGLTTSATWVFGIAAAALGRADGPRLRWAQRYGLGAIYLLLAVAAAVAQVGT